MIARPFATSYVCLRCQNRLTKRYGRALNQRVWQTTKARIEPNFTLLDNNEANSSLEDVAQISHRPLRNHKAARNKPEERLWGFKGPMLSEDSEHLNVEVLGRPADVVVLRESKLSTYRRKKFTKEMKTQEAVDILRTVEKETGLPVEKEVLGNIDGLRPSSGKEPQVWAEWNDLVRIVERGFMVSQLSKYLILRGPETQPAKSSHVQLSPHIRKITPWMPGIDELSEIFNDNPSRGYMKASFTFKQNLALKIMRECWELELPEVSGGIGQQEIILDGSAFDLLTRGVHSRFYTIQAQYIFTSEKMEAFHRRKAIRVTARRAKAELIIQRIVEAVCSIEEMHLPLNLLEPLKSENGRLQLHVPVEHVFNDAVIKQLGQLTDTKISKEKGAAVLIRSMQDAPEAETSSQMDIVRRLFLTSFDRSYVYKRSLECQAPAQPEGVFVPYPATTGMPWRERLQEWKRWALPVRKIPETTTKAERLLDKSDPLWTIVDKPATVSSLRSGTFTPNAELQTTDKSRAKYTNWNHSPFDRTSIVVGSVLHSFGEGQATELNHLTASQLRPQISRMFLSSAPNISQLLKDSSTATPIMSERILLRLLPNPWALGQSGQPVGEQALVCFPPVEITFAYGEEARNLILKKMRAVIDFESSDLLLPECQHDLRLERDVSCGIAPDISSNSDRFVDCMPSVASFISKSKLDPRNDQSLSAPAGLVLPISRYCCRPGVKDLLREPPQSVDYHVDYLYAGLEYRNSLAFDYQGWRLVYTSIEAGKAGGRRSELRLCPIRQDMHAARAQDFLKAALSLANAHTVSSRGIRGTRPQGAQSSFKRSPRNAERRAGFGRLLSGDPLVSEDAEAELLTPVTDHTEKGQGTGSSRLAADVENMMKTLQNSAGKKSERITG